jgi:hypothetical protein
MPAYDIVPADPVADRERILAVWKRNLNAHDPHEHEVRYDWICRSPLGPPRIWLALHQGAPVGTAGLMMRRVWVDGAPRVASIAGDFAVDARHRMLQPAMSLQKAVLGALEDGVDIVYGLPNRNALKIFERQGYKVAGPLSRYVKVLKTGKYFESAKGRLRFAKPLAPLADLALRLRSRETWRRRVGGRVLEPVQRFDGRFDALWDRVAGRAPVMGVRTSDFLQWRFAECPLQRYATLGLAEGRGGRVLGYITWYLGDDGQWRIADWVSDGTDGVAEDLLAGMLGAARRGGAVSVSCEFFGIESLPAVLGRFGFVRRDCAATLTVSAKPALGDGFFDKVRGWYFLRGDENVNTL